MGWYNRPIVYRQHNPYHKTMHVGHVCLRQHAPTKMKITSLFNETSFEVGAALCALSTSESIKERVSVTDWGSYIDRQIRKAMEDGDFDNLPGEGKPLDL